MNNKQTVDAMRRGLIKGILEFKTPPDEYIGLWVRYCATIRFIDGKRLTYTGPAYTGVLQPQTLDDMPLEGLLDMYDAMKEAREARDQPDVRRPRSDSTPDLERHIRDWG